MVASTAGGFGQLLGAASPACLVCEGGCTHQSGIQTVLIFTPCEVDPMAELHTVTERVYVDRDGDRHDGTKDGYLRYTVGDRISLAEARRYGLVPEVGPTPVIGAPDKELQGQGGG